MSSVPDETRVVRPPGLWEKPTRGREHGPDRCKLPNPRRRIRAPWPRKPMPAARLYALAGGDRKAEWVALRTSVVGVLPPVIGALICGLLGFGFAAEVGFAAHSATSPCGAVMALAVKQAQARDAGRGSRGPGRVDRHGERGYSGRRSGQAQQGPRRYSPSLPGAPQLRRRAGRRGDCDRAGPERPVGTP